MRARLRFLQTVSGAIGAAIVLFILTVAIFGRYLAPHDPTQPIGLPLSGASGKALLGTDILGRDVVSRLLYGGRSLIALALAATVLAYIIGLAIGLVAGYTRSKLDPLLMRTVDVMFAFPPLLFVLVLMTGAGTGGLGSEPRARGWICVARGGTRDDRTVTRRSQSRCRLMFPDKARLRRLLPRLQTKSKLSLPSR